jgi:hypothetical protein
MPQQTLGQRAAAALKQAKIKARKEEGRDLSWEEVATIIDSCQPMPGKHTKPAPIPRKRNELLDALVEACGGRPDELTKQAIRSAAVALADIKTVCPNLDREEIFRRVAIYKSKHRDWAVTPAAIAKHWANCGGGARTSSAKTDIYCEPPDWRNPAATILGISATMLTDKSWFDLGPDTRAQVLRNLNT